MNREDFAILTQTVHNRPLTYLDNAATSQKPQQVIDAISFAYTHFNSNIHRAVHHLAQVATEEHEQARRKVASFIGAANKEEIVFTKGTTDSINLVAFCWGERFISQGDEVVISALEHHSNIVPWQMMCLRKGATLKVAPITDKGYIDIEALDRLLTGHTKLVAVSMVSNVLGTRQNVERIIRLAHDKGIAVLVDGAQGVPHEQVDVQAMDCDFLAFSAHKMYGPTGVGILYGKEKWLNALDPYQGGGEMIDHVRWSGTTYNVLPYKFEAGTPDYIGSYAFGVALDYMSGLGLQHIKTHEQTIMHHLEDELSRIQGVRIYASGEEKEGALSFNVFHDGKLIHPFDIGMLLDQQGVAVRTGHHCAEPLVEHLGCGGTVRVSVGLYNDETDIARFIMALNKAIAMLK